MNGTEDELSNPLGELIRQQRELAALPLRQLASLVGISNPYLSQIERGLRAPSEAVKERIAETLRIPPDALSGDSTGEEQQQSACGLLAMINTDDALTPAQRRALAEIYTAMAKVTAANRRRRGGAGGHRAMRGTRAANDSPFSST
jgi:transcriptional regulator with XRE-family HTH domain